MDNNNLISGNIDNNWNVLVDLIDIWLVENIKYKDNHGIWFNWVELLMEMNGINLISKNINNKWNILMFK